MNLRKNRVNASLTGSQRHTDLVTIRSNPHTAQRQIGELRFVRTWIDAKRLHHEPALQELAWVEYRYMSPLERTAHFAELYQDAYRAAYAKACPEEDASKRRPIEPEFARNTTDVMNSLWEARARADALGMPYDIYLTTVIAGHFENDHWKRPPRPNQLYGKLMPARLRGRPTNEEIAARLYGDGWDARFFAEAYVGDPVQEAAIAHMRADVLQAPDPGQRLARYLVERRATTLERAKSAFGDDLVYAAISIGGHLPQVVPSGGGSEPFHPSCFGFPAVLKDSVCADCSVNMACADRASAARDELLRVSGTDDPRADRKRQLDAMRQRLHRERIRRTELKDTDGDAVASSPPPSQGSADAAAGGDL